MPVVAGLRPAMGTSANDIHKPNKIVRGL